MAPRESPLIIPVFRIPGRGLALRLAYVFRSCFKKNKLKFFTSFKCLYYSINKLFCATNNFALSFPQATAGRLSFSDVIVFGLRKFFHLLRLWATAGCTTRPKPPTLLNLVAIVIVHHKLLFGLHNPGCFNINGVGLEVIIPWGSPLGHWLVFQGAVPRLPGISAVDQPSWPAEEWKAKLVSPNRVGVQDP